MVKINRKIKKNESYFDAHVLAAHELLVSLPAPKKPPECSNKKVRIQFWPTKSKGEAKTYRGKDGKRRRRKMVSF